MSLDPAQHLVERDEFIAGGKDSGGWLLVDREGCCADGGCQGDFSCGDACAGMEDCVAQGGFGGAGDDVFAWLEGAVVSEGESVTVQRDVFEHDDGVRACWDGCASHDFDGLAGLEG